MMPLQPRMNRNEVLESIANYNQYGKAIRRNQSLQDIAMKLAEISELAEEAVLSEADDWFDAHTLKRNMKEIKGYSSEFQKLAAEADMTEQRMAALYEDMGRVLERYFEIHDTDERESPDGSFEKGKAAELSRQPVPANNMVRESSMTGGQAITQDQLKQHSKSNAPVVNEASDQMTLRAIKAVFKHLQATDSELATRFAKLPPKKMKQCVWKLVR